ncbi:McrB family protein [Colwellia sp. RSH04]|uniref:McrB family protein n=1 Tax=Colwellia sp. RSH04 TaxID=2305464 RepID=UPI00217533A8|nr:AAA family ATPase [Colwellia sp. RSH04]
MSVKTLKAVYNQEKEIKGGLQPYYGALIEHLSHTQITQTENQIERKNFVLVIDEINRGNISKVFGELITLIEPSKRLGQKESLEVVLPYSGEKFSVPDNLYIIGTMNTADRSLALMDTALRRRFDFVEMMPDYKVLHNEENQPYKIEIEGYEIDLVLLLKTLNKRILALYDREHELGHAFLIAVVKEIIADRHEAALYELANCFQNKIIPLLAEYFFEDWQKIRLVLGDNQKPKAYQLIKQSDIDYEVLFGDSDEVTDFADDAQDFTLIDNNSKLWKQALTYIGMYKASQLPKDED